MINNIDFLSPPITLFHLERRTHTSKVGACLVIFLVIVCLSYAIFLLYNLIAHKKMTYIFHKKFEFEAGYYSFNSSSIFHFIQIFAPQNGGYFDKFNSRYIRAYTTYAQSNLTYSNLDLYDHWVFDECRKDIDDKDLDPSLFQNVENFTNGVCIRYYYNSSERRYYSSEENGFIWPFLEHGISHRKNIYLTTIVQKCSNDSIINELFGMCPSQKEIDDYVSRYFAIYLYFTDTQVDPTNFENPVTQYLQVVSTGIGTSQIYVESYMHFSPLRVITKLGSIFGKTHEINSFYFDFNRKGAANNAGEKYFTITRYYHLMQNNVQIYERRYNNIFDLFSEIGGITQFIFYLFYWINYAYNQFIIDYDTNYLFFSLRDKKESAKGNNNIKIATISNKIQIQGNDNKIYNIQNNILKLSKKDSKKYNDKFFVDKNSKKESNDDNEENINNKENISSEFENNINDTDNNLNVITINKKTSIGKKRILGAKKSNNDNSKDTFFNLDLKKNLELIDKSEQINKISANNASNNSNNIRLNNNNNIIKKENIINEDVDNKNIIDDNFEKKISNESNNKDFEDIIISKISVNQINYKRINKFELNKGFKRDKSFSIVDYTKSILFKKAKKNYLYLKLFRKHLLSEEHLLKSHVNIVLLEKRYKINDNETTNVFECYNKL